METQSTAHSPFQKFILGNSCPNLYKSRYQNLLVLTNFCFIFLTFYQIFCKRLYLLITILWLSRKLQHTFLFQMTKWKHSFKRTPYQFYKKHQWQLRFYRFPTVLIMGPMEYFSKSIYEQELYDISIIFLLGRTHISYFVVKCDCLIILVNDC